jgi:hypothetical protein
LLQSLPSAFRKRSQRNATSVSSSKGKVRSREIARNA